MPCIWTSRHPSLYAERPSLNLLLYHWHVFNCFALIRNLSVRYVETTVIGDEGPMSVISKNGVISMGCDALVSLILRISMKSHQSRYIILSCWYVFLAWNYCWCINCSFFSCKYFGIVFLLAPVRVGFCFYIYSPLCWFMCCWHAWCKPELFNDGCSVCTYS